MTLMDVLFCTKTCSSTACTVGSSCTRPCALVANHAGACVCMAHDAAQKAKLCRKACSQVVDPGHYAPCCGMPCAYEAGHKGVCECKRHVASTASSLTEKFEKFEAAAAATAERLREFPQRGTDPSCGTKRFHTHGAASLGTTLDLIREACDELYKMLAEKNQRYGDSALNPVRLMSKASPVEQILVRIDDKLSRVSKGSGVETEDVELDLLGYFLLLRVARKMTGSST